MTVPSENKYLRKMAYNYPSQNIERTKEMLMAIGRTNLMAPSKEEFGRIIDRDLSKNSVSKLKLLSDFSVSAIFHELESIVEIESDGLLSLELLLARYERSERYYKETLRSFLRAKSAETLDKLYAMMDYVILANSPCDDSRNTSWDKHWAEALRNKVDLRIVVLMAIGVLPAYSGKGMAISEPLDVTRSFIMGYLEREDSMLAPSAEYYKMVINAPYNLNDRIASVAVFYKFCKIVTLSFSIDLSRHVIENSTEARGMDINYLWEYSRKEKNDMPVLWWNEKVEHEFWFFEYIGNGYYMTKCNTATRTFTKYTLFTGSELGTDIGRVLHPKSIFSMIEGNGPEYSTVVSWMAEFNRKEEAQKIVFNLMSRVGDSDDWAKELRRLTLVRMSETHRNYALFAKLFQRDGERWKLNERFENAYPGTEYILAHSMYAVARDHILVQDVVESKENPLGFELIPNKYYKVGREWLDDEIELGDDVGVLILGTDMPNKPHKKYLALDYCCRYFPIVDDEILFS